MWILNNIETGQKFILLQSQQKYTITRSANACVGDLVLPNDTSISRTHAYIYPRKDTLKLIDCGSKYGTFINANIDINITVEPNKETIIKPQDRIRFGRFKNIWIVEYTQIQTLTSSTLSDTDKKQLKYLIDALDGEIIETFSKNCTHLTVQNLKVTVKVLESLANAIPIVTIAYWQMYLTAIQTGKTLPNLDNFMPKLIEPYLGKNASFAVDINRRRLFLGKTFVFMIKKHKEKFENIIELAGGKCISLDVTKCRKTGLIQDTKIVVNYVQSTQSQGTQDITNVGDYIRSHKLRMIPDCEIGLAIVHCSIEKFCNPKHSIEENFMVASEFDAGTSKILAQNTPLSTVTSLKSTAPEIVVSESQNFDTPKTDKNDHPELNVIDVIDLDTQPFIVEQHIEKSTSPLPIIVEMEAAKRKHSPVSDNERPSKRQPIIVEKSVEMPTNLLPEITDMEAAKRKHSPVSDNERPSKRQPLIVEKNVERPTNLLPEIIDMDAAKRKHSPLSDQNERPSKRQTIDRIHMLKDNVAASKEVTNSQSGWFKKPSTQLTNATPKPKETIQIEQPSKPVKRPHDLLQDDNDGSEDESNANLFQFNLNPRKTPKKKAKPSRNSDDDEDNNFRFPCSIPSSSLTKKRNQTQTTAMPSTSKSIVPTVKNVKPYETSSTGWKCRSKSNDIKNESEMIKKEETIYDDDNTEKWINSIRKSFQVIVISMNLTAVSANQSIFNVSKQQQNSTGPNFKAFVKKNNYQPSTGIIKTLIPRN